MRYFGIPCGMWLLFKTSFRKNLTAILGFDRQRASNITLQAKRKYKNIIAELPEFEPKDSFKINLVSCAMFSSFLLNIEEKPTMEEAAKYYEKSMMTPLMRLFCRQSGKKRFSAKDIKSMKKTAALRAGDKNPYSWNMEFYEYKDGSGYESRFTSCGIYTLMKELGLSHLTSAMCRLDYAMAEAGGTADFARKYTIAEGFPYCDCGYRKKGVETNV